MNYNRQKSTTKYQTKMNDDTTQLLILEKKYLRNSAATINIEYGALLLAKELLLIFFNFAVVIIKLFVW